MRRKSHPMVRIALLVTGIALLGTSPLVGLLPGPGGVFVAAAGIILILRNSRWARRRFVRLKARWPRAGDFIDRILIRGSAKRRRERAKSIAAN